ncbi:MAG: tRNA (N6-isopentenyl adenosine(37)-C2)-methylthiotransferase MiaB [Deltaproteobacteria bacterium]|nr:tRNA (N6-isopentenyl adenosine(37)-C2)-methylthiotransferase MiaB [Deltaproteobacteria bacterium]
MQRSLHIKTFGCQMNVYDSDRMQSILSARGFRAEPELRKADVILINTCSIRDKSEQKVLSLLGELKGLKQKDPKKVIAISGCVGQRMGRTLLQRVPHLDLVLGPDAIDRVGELIENVISRGERLVEAKFDAEGRSYSQPCVVHKAKPSEFLTIMKGCDHFCTYCIVPFVRGREKSRSIEEIIQDVKNLVEKGTKEVTFLGQNINTYGKGTGQKLSQLIEATNQIQGLERIRYVTSHPRDLGEDLIAQFGMIEKLCPALHLPFQSGSNRILKAMSRLYTQELYLSKIELLRKTRADIALSTDVIVGFPGETEEDFQETLKVLKEVKFSSAFMFKYSPRPGTKAAEFGEEVAEPIKEERLARAQEVVYSQIELENKRYDGTTVPVLIESMDKKKKYFSGRNPHAKLVHVMNVGEASVGKIIDVEITESNVSCLKGFYVGAPKKHFNAGRVEENLSASLSIA